MTTERTRVRTKCKSCQFIHIFLFSTKSRVSEFQTTVRQTCHALTSAPYEHVPQQITLQHILTPLPFRSGPAAVQTQWVRICSFSEVLGFQTLSELACEAHEQRSACGPCPQAGPLRSRPLRRDARAHELRLPVGRDSWSGPYGEVRRRCSISNSQLPAYWVQ